MPDHKIYILNSNVTDGSLTLSDGGVTEVHILFSGPVSWEIRDSKVESFMIIGKYPGDPFKDPLPVVYQSDVKLKVKEIVLKDWKYSIKWIDRATHTVHTFDPKIAVKPGVGFNIYFVLTIAVMSLFFGFRLFQRVKNNSKRKKASE